MRIYWNLLNFTSVVSLILVSVCSAGCGAAGRPEEKTYPVSGTVTLDESPLPEGEILFKDTSTGSVHLIPIKDGKYQGRASAGTKRVEIYAYKMEIDPVAKEMYGAEAQPTKVNYLPPKYNQESNLTANVEATTDPAKNTFNFQVTSQ